MKLHIQLTGLLMLVCCTAVTAQKTISLTPEPITVNEKFHFRNIKVMDNRIDTNILGRVVKGTFGISEALAPLKLKTSFTSEYEIFIKECAATLTPGETDILINVTDIFVDEDPTTGAFGTVDVRAEVYAEKDGLYYPIHTFDRYEVLTAFDATKKLIRDLTASLKNVVEISNNFFSPKIFDTKGLTHAEVLQRKDQYRVEKYPVYASDIPKDGIYTSYTEFIENNPGRPISMFNDVMAKNLEKPKRKRENLWGYCSNGQIYMFTDTKYDTVRVYKRDKNFYMQAYGMDDSKQTTQNVLSWFSPAALLLNTESWYEYVMNPRSGTFYQLNKLGTRKRSTQSEPASDENTNSSSDW